MCTCGTADRKSTCHAKFLNGTGISDAGLRELGELKDLTVLYLSRTAITDAGLKELRKLTNLSELEARLTRITDDGVNDLRKSLPNVKIDREGPSFD
jgi:internalin A